MAMSLVVPCVGILIDHPVAVQHAPCDSSDLCANTRSCKYERQTPRYSFIKNSAMFVTERNSIGVSHYLTRVALLYERTGCDESLKQKILRF